MLSVLALTALAAAECGTDSIDTLHGDEPLVSQLLDAAKTFSVGMFSDGAFESRDTVYIGQLAGPSGPLHLAWVETIWGASSCRASQQLIVFDDTLRPVGRYVSIERPEFVAPDTLSIPYEEQPPTRWTFTGTLPECLEVADDCFPLQGVVYP